MLTTAPALEGARWRKSTRTNGGNDPQCVELACLPAGGAVRDSKQPTGAALIFTASAFQAFIAQARSGHLDQH